jgi:putative two-component system response regulator
MPGIDGFQVLEMMRDQSFSTIPVIIITANNEKEHEKRGLRLGAVDFVSKPFDPDIIHYRVDSHVRLKAYQDKLESMVEESVEKMSVMWTSVIEAMADILECRSLESGQHIKRCSFLVKLMCQQMSKKQVYDYFFTPKQTRFVAEACILHDIGKVGIPDSILLKPGSLSDDEFAVMKTHTTIGADISKKITQYSDPEYAKYAYQIILSHHERWDGRGYPQGLKAKDIPLAARILSIIDTYDAVTNDRCYRRAMTHEKAVEIVKEMRGTQFDPFLVDIFLEVENDIPNYIITLK